MYWTLEIKGEGMKYIKQTFWWRMVDPRKKLDALSAYYELSMSTMCKDIITSYANNNQCAILAKSVMIPTTKREKLK
jgi:hypothetical protein